MKESKTAKIRRGLKEAFQQPKYAFLSLGIAVLFFVVNVLLPNSKTIGEVLKTQGISATVQFVLILVEGSFGSMTITSSILLIAIATLLGMVVSLMVYKIKTMQGSSVREGRVTTVGAVLGVVAPGCASCGIGVLSLFGLTGSLAVLPFKGAEIGLLSVALLLTATASLAMRIAEGNTCRIEFKKKQR